MNCSTFFTSLFAKGLIKGEGETLLAPSSSLPLLFFSLQLSLSVEFNASLAGMPPELERGEDIE